MRDQDILAQARTAFVVEAADLLAQLESSLLSLAEEPDGEALNAAFRAAHTIKGSAGLFGMDAVVSFTHDVEALLDRLRTGSVPVTDSVVTLLLECRDQIERLLGAETSEDAIDARHDESVRLQELLCRARGVAPPSSAPAPEPAAPAAAPQDDAPAGDPDWLVHARFGAETFAMGFDPLSFLRYLPTVAEVKAAELDLEAVPALDELDPESCRIALAVRLQGAKDKRSIEAVFDFVIDSIELHIVPPADKVREMHDLLAGQEDAGERLGAMLVRVGALTERELDQCLHQQSQGAAGGDAEARPPLRLGEAVTEAGLAPAELVQAAVQRQGQLREKKSEESRFIRVAADKLDALIAMIGELVIAGSATNTRAGTLGDAQMTESAARVMSLVEGARDRALQLRMVPIGETFSRFRRVVHDVCKSLGKEAELTITGGDTELDKSMVDQIVDPLTHLVRNALDHGLETAEQRLAAGKPARGQLGLNAYHESGSVVIEVTDDGRGLARDRIFAKAVERGLVSASATLSDEEVFQHIFLPGFSTAERVTDLSGRGVGMDVVRRNIEALRGTIAISSQAGAGTRIEIRLPLTLAIIDGFLVGVGNSTFVLPLHSVLEVIEDKVGGSVADERGQSITDLRGHVLPVVDLRRMYALESPEPERSSIVVIQAARRRYGVRVDRLLGQQQTVIKPLGRLFRKLQGLAGSTILGNGEVALIFDMNALCHLVEQPASGAPSTARPTSLASTSHTATVH